MNFSTYHEYLSKRSSLGYLYRKFLLYPKLNEVLKGVSLDVGCGIGDMLKFRSNMIGVDINPVNVNYCKDQGLNCFVMQSGLLPFQPNSFDSVLLDNVLEHVEGPEDLIAEVNRVLRLGGILLVGVPGVKGYLSDPDHKFFYDEKALKLLVEEHGFLIKEYFYMPLFKSKWLSDRLRQYCIYSVWTKIR